MAKVRVNLTVVLSLPDDFNQRLAAGEPAAFIDLEDGLLEAIGSQDVYYTASELKVENIEKEG